MGGRGGARSHSHLLFCSQSHIRSLNHGPDPHVMVGGAILTSPRGITSMGSVLVEEALVEEVDGEADVVGIVKS